MSDEVLSLNKRIRDRAPFRKSISLTDEDIQRLSYLEKLFSERYPLEVPFSFSKTISKAVELTYRIVLDQRLQVYLGDGFILEMPAEQSKMLSSDKTSEATIKANDSQEMLKQESLTKDLNTIPKTENSVSQRAGKPKRFQKKKRGF